MFSKRNIYFFSSHFYLQSEKNRFRYSSNICFLQKEIKKINIDLTNRLEIELNFIVSHLDDE
jgi:hypothetical protein